MAVASTSHFHVTIIFLTTLFNPIAFAHFSQPKNHVALFAFGDSLLDPGNNNYINTTTQFQANFPPYGESYFKYPTGRFSNGRLIPDFIAEYAKLPLIPPYLDLGDHDIVYGVNFASGGAGALLETYQGMVINLRTQMSYFSNVEKQLKEKLGDKEAEELLSNSVYLLSIGGNDYLSTYGTNSSIFYLYNLEDYMDMVIGNFTAIIKEIYGRGGRKFIVFNLPGLGCWPSIRAINTGNDCAKEVTNLTKMHNEAFSKNIKNLEMQLKGFMYSKFDLDTFIDERMSNPSKYGFMEGEKACCGSGPYNGVYSCGGMREVEEYELCDNPSDYLFFDSNHLTETATQQLSMLMWNGDTHLLESYSVKSLFEVKQLCNI